MPFIIIIIKIIKIKRRINKWNIKKYFSFMAFETDLTNMNAGEGISNLKRLKLIIMVYLIFQVNQ